MESIACNALYKAINSSGGEIFESKLLEYESTCELDEKTVVIYTESVIGNPLNAKKYITNIASSSRKDTTNYDTSRT
jgi:hypothetical protein